MLLNQGKKQDQLNLNSRYYIFWICGQQEVLDNFANYDNNLK